jgi:hypothetical protein
MLGMEGRISKNKVGGRCLGDEVLLLRIKIQELTVGERLRLMMTALQNILNLRQTRH